MTRHTCGGRAPGDIEGGETDLTCATKDSRQPSFHVSLGLSSREKTQTVLKETHELRENEDYEDTKDGILRGNAARFYGLDTASK